MSEWQGEGMSMELEGRKSDYDVDNTETHSSDLIMGVSMETAGETGKESVCEAVAGEIPPLVEIGDDDNLLNCKTTVDAVVTDDIIKDVDRLLHCEASYGSGVIQKIQMGMPYNVSGETFIGTSSPTAVEPLSGTVCEIKSVSSQQGNACMELEVETICKRVRPRRNCAGSDSKVVDNMANGTPETADYTSETTNGVRRSARRRVLKRKMNYDVFEDDVGSTSCNVKKGGNEWTLEEEGESLNDDKGNPSSLPTAASDGKGALTRKVIVRRRKMVTGRKEAVGRIKKKSSLVKDSFVNQKQGGNVDGHHCKNCEMFFRSQSQFENHMLICGALKPVDDKSLTSKTKNIMTRARSCPVCQKSFARLNGMKRHFAFTHANLFQYSCVLCSRRIGDISDTYKHFKKEHQQSFPKENEHVARKMLLVCPLCNFSIRNEMDIKQHLVNAHSNLVRVSCTLCQRSVQSMLQCAQHFTQYHLHSSAPKKSRSEMVFTNTVQAIKPIDAKTNSMKDCTKTSTDVICLQCNKYIGNYKLLALHMLSHKVDENTEIVGRKASALSSAESNTEQNPSGTNFIPGLPTENSCDTLAELFNLSFTLGPDLVSAISRSLTVMTELAANLDSELQWKDTDDSSCTRKDLVKKLNKLILVSSSISDIGKCVLLVLEECIQVEANLFVDSDDVCCELDDDCFENEDSTEVMNNTCSTGGNECDYTEVMNNRCTGGNERHYSEALNKVLKDPDCKDSLDVTVTLDRETDLHTGDILNNAPVVKAECMPKICPDDTVVRLNKVRGENEKLKLEVSSGRDNCDTGANSTDSKHSDGVASHGCAFNSTTTTTSSSSEVTKPSKGNKKFVCKICGMQSKRSYHLKRHMLTHSDLKPFKCKLCLSNFKSKEHLRLHSRLHLAQKKYKCDFCDLFERTKQQIKKHCLDEHPHAPLFPCDSCTHQAKTTYHLADHKAYHDTKKCKHCDFESPSRYVLDRHMDENHGEFVCPECNYRCWNIYRLKCHVKKHYKSDGGTLYCCEKCGATFNTRAKLKYHVVRHENKTPLSCNQCDYKCSSKQSLATHLQKHTGHRPFKCSVCKAAFFSSSKLNHHMVIHSNVKSFCCKYCGKGFAYKTNCQEHEMTHTGEKKYKCKFCDFASRRRKMLMQHMAEHKASGTDMESSVDEEEETDATAVSDEIVEHIKTEI